MRNNKKVIQQAGSNGDSLLVFGRYPVRLSTQTPNVLRFFVVYSAPLSKVPIMHPVIRSENWRQRGAALKYYTFSGRNLLSNSGRLSHGGLNTACGAKKPQKVYIKLNKNYII
jgi:hypothetical protein